MNGTQLQEKDAECSFDYILATGGNVNYKKVCNELQPIPESRILLDRSVCIPNFTVEKWNRLKAGRPTVFSRNCSAGYFYHTMGMEFLSPIINMFLSPVDYLKFVQSPKVYLEKRLEFLKIEDENGKASVPYPLFALGDIKLHMNHYGKLGKEYAERKWEERKQRVNWNNLVAINVIDDNESFVASFDTVQGMKKACFTKTLGSYDSAYPIDHCRNQNTTLFRSVNEYFDGRYQCYDMWEMVLYGKKMPIQYQEKMKNIFILLMK